MAIHNRDCAEVHSMLRQPFPDPTDQKGPVKPSSPKYSLFLLVSFFSNTGQTQKTQENCQQERVQPQQVGPTGCSTLTLLLPMVTF